jgi:hypothetical protein
MSELHPIEPALALEGYETRVDRKEFLPEDPLASPPASVWVRWYFARGWLSLFTVPLFLMLLMGAYESAKGGCIILIALIRASGAVVGFVGAFLAVSVGWILAFLPFILYYSLLRNIPGFGSGPTSQPIKVERDFLLRKSGL